MFKFKNNNQIAEQNKLEKIIENQENIKHQLNQIIELMKNNNKTKNNQTNILNNEDNDFYDEPLLESVIERILQEECVSTSFIQKNFKIGYARTGRIVDRLEKLGIISKYQGAKPRKVLFTVEQWNNEKENILKK